MTLNTLFHHPFFGLHATEIRSRLKEGGKVLALVFVVAFLTACASPIAAKVTSFNQWPDNAAGSTCSYITPADKVNDLEQAAYEGYVQVELKKLGLKRAAPRQVGQIQVDLVTGSGTKDKKYREAVYQDYYVYQPPFRDARAVFESRAAYEGDNEDLPDLVPYLVRAVFDGFPGQNGRAREVRLDSKSGEMVKK